MNFILKKIKVVVVFFMLLNLKAVISIQQTLKPSQYSNLSGRMIYLPEVPAHIQEAIITKQSQQGTQQNIKEELEKAQLRNEKFRTWQLERSIRRKPGSYHEQSHQSPLSELTNAHP